jgi:arylsulfatase A-like enzyme
VLTACSPAPSTSPAPAAAPEKQNVLFIIVDDLKPLLGAYGADQIISPNIDALAASGTLFTNAHAQQAICAASRMSFMTGMRPDRTRIWDLQTKMRDENPNALTLPEYFKQNEYQTVGLGKVMHGAKNNDAQSWTMDFVNDTDLTYPEGYEMPANGFYQGEELLKGYQKNEEEQSASHLNDDWFAVNARLKAANLRPSVEMADVPDDAYTDGAAARKTVELMEGFRQKKQPFMVTIGFKKPHLPFVAPTKYWELYQRENIQLASHQGAAEGAPAFAYHNNGELKNYSDIAPHLDENGRVDDDKQRELIHGYYACVSYIDAQIGLLTDYLKESGLDKNTAIVLVGDHGWHLGDHGLWNKHSNFEQATRTPLIFSAPGLPAGQRNDSPVELVDIFPTICDLAGLAQTEDLQGKSLLPILEGRESRVKSAALSQYPRNCNVVRKAMEQYPDACDIMGYAVRDDRYRYVAWYQGSYTDRNNFNADAIVAEELYDYKNDPLETISVVDQAQYAEVKAVLLKFLAQNIFATSQTE